MILSAVWLNDLQESDTNALTKVALMTAIVEEPREENGRVDVNVERAALRSNMAPTKYIDAMHQAQDLGWLKELTWLAGQSAMTAKLAIPGR